METVWVFPDNAIKRELSGLKVQCTNTGCDWQGIFRAYEVELEEMSKHDEKAQVKHLDMLFGVISQLMVQLDAMKVDPDRKRNDAISGRTTSIYSPCFFTSRHGYKMCARVYLNGDGMGKGNHVSLFFVIMRGSFDALLRWPFRQKVTFMLLDQNNREHVIDAFRPDPTSNSFKRPTGDMNIASGCPLFMPLSQLDSSRHAYVKDDCMFIKVIVDTTDIN
ncbi:TNF receptor-associated factor 2-like [Saccoglossus kowalevskii]